MLLPWISLSHSMDYSALIFCLKEFLDLISTLYFRSFKRLVFKKGVLYDYNINGKDLKKYEYMLVL